MMRYTHPHTHAQADTDTGAHARMDTHKGTGARAHTRARAPSHTQPRQVGWAGPLLDAVLLVSALLPDWYRTRCGPAFMPSPISRCVRACERAGGRAGGRVGGLAACCVSCVACCMLSAAMGLPFRRPMACGALRHEMQRAVPVGSAGSHRAVALRCGPSAFSAGYSEYPVSTQSTQWVPE